MSHTSHHQRYLEHLADEIERLYAAEHFDEARFSTIAASCLATATGLDGVGVSDLLPFYLASLQEHEDADPGDFSDFPLAICRRRHFFLQILVWTRGSTTIHQHSFSGAFRVVAGSSMQINYKFDESRRVNSRLRIGAVTRVDSGHFNVGHTEEILPAGGLTHSVFHLQCPSISLVVRTYGEAWCRPQLLLRPSTFALDGSSLRRDRDQLLRFIDSLEPSQHIDTVGALCSRIPQELLVYCAMELEEKVGSERLMLQASGRFGHEFAEQLAASITHERRFLAVHKLRADIEAKEQRMLLCILGYASNVDELTAEAMRFQLLCPGDEATVWDLLSRLLCYPGPPMKFGDSLLSELLPALVGLADVGEDECSNALAKLTGKDREATGRIGSMLRNSPVFEALRYGATRAL